MSKSTLGRGLGDLLGSNRTEASPSAPMKPPGVGLRILIDGGTQPQTESAPPPPAPSVTIVPPHVTDSEVLTRLLAVLALVGADLGLLGWTAHHVLVHRDGLSVPALVACAGSVLLAAFCGCAAARLVAGRG